MTDRMTPQQRHHCMSRIRSTNTKPELVVRRFLWRNGWRYRLHRKGLPGKPDIVISRLKTVIFINGCFWHGHECNKRLPQTNADFWQRKIERNRQRDIENGIALRRLGWNVITIWECELHKAVRDATLERLLNTLRSFETSPIKQVQQPYAFYNPDYDYNPVAAEPDSDYRPINPTTDNS